MSTVKRPLVSSGEGAGHLCVCQTDSRARATARLGSEQKIPKSVAQKTN